MHSIQPNVEMGVKGEYRAEVHTGHTHDADGNITKEGIVIRSTAWGKNKITLNGFSSLLQNGTFSVKCVAGTGNATPAESDGVLGVYKGQASTTTYALVVYTTADVNGYFRIEHTYRATFNPGALGAGAMNIAEAGMALASVPNSGTALLSRGLLVDGAGTPTTVSLDASTEYLDIYWKYTIYVPSLISGTQNLTILGVSTSHTYTIRPIFLDPTLTNTGINVFGQWWGTASSSTLPGLAPTVNAANYVTPYLQSRVFDGAIPSGSLVSYPAGNSLGQSSYTMNAYVAASKQRTFSLVMVPTDGNLAAGIRSMTLRWILCGWMMELSPVIVKSATPARSLRLDFQLSMANYP